MSHMLQRHWHHFSIALLVLSTFWLPLHARAQVPLPEGAVTDLAGVLSPHDRKRLTEVLSSYERETSHQLAVLTVASLSGEPIENFSLRIARAWGLGRKGVDNGILVVLALQERKVRVELGRGFERFISNAQAQQIVNSMFPAFRRGAYAEGLESGIRQLMQEGRAFVAPTVGKGR